MENGILRISGLILLLLLGTGLRCSQPRPPESSPANDYFVPGGPPEYRTEGIRIATLNAEFLFDGDEDEGGADFPWKGDSLAAAAHRDRVGAAIRRLDADVVVLQEVETTDVLDAMIAGPLQGLGYTAYLVPGLDTFTRQNVGLLSRVPVDSVGRTEERLPVGLTDSDYGVSKNLWAHLTIGGVPTTLIGVHLLAQPDNRERLPRREIQAEIIRRHVEREQASGRAVIVIGDINDFDNETPDVRGSRPITNVLQRIKAAGPGPEDDLVNVLADVQQSNRFTSFYDRDDDGRIDPGEFSAIDHILLSPVLYEMVREVHYVHMYDPREVSDHFPIVVTIAE